MRSLRLVACMWSTVVVAGACGGGEMPPAGPAEPEACEQASRREFRQEWPEPMDLPYSIGIVLGETTYSATCPTEAPVTHEDGTALACDADFILLRRPAEAQPLFPESGALSLLLELERADGSRGIAVMSFELAACEAAP